MDNQQKSNSPASALLVMDVQTNIVGRLGEAAKNLISSVQGAIATARAAGIPIIYVVVGFRKGLPEVSLDNKSFSAYKPKGSELTGLEEPILIYPAVTPQPGDIVVTKRRVSAFTGSDLEVVLRSLKVQHLVLAGISTSGVILSTIREAADKDYHLSLLSDCCADPDPEVHTMLLSKVFPRQADVLTADQWSATIK